LEVQNGNDPAAQAEALRLPGGDDAPGGLKEGDGVGGRKMPPHLPGVEAPLVAAGALGHRLNPRLPAAAAGGAAGGPAAPPPSLQPAAAAAAAAAGGPAAQLHPQPLAGAAAGGGGRGAAAAGGTLGAAVGGGRRVPPPPSGKGRSQWSGGGP